MKSNRSIHLLMATCLMLSTAAAAAEWKPELMDEATEIKEALAAGPPSIRDDAGVYVLRSSGFELVRQSGNGFHCIVGRSQLDSFEPQCFDPAGSASLLRQTLLRGELQMQGQERGEIDRAIKAAWEAGELQAPGRPGINYMLSEKNMVPVGPDRVIPFGPHLMFYAPNMSDADIGGDRTGQTSPIFMINPGQPSGYVIVPVAGHTVGGG